MKKIYFLIAFLISLVSFGQSPIITTIVDGDCSGGNPKLLEIYADGTVDFSLYSLQNQTNANTTWGATQDLSSFGTVTDDFVYVTTSGSSTAIGTEFPSLSGATILTSGTMNLNGDDRIRIIETATTTVVDQYGAEGTDGTGETWEYADSYAKRVDGTGPDGGFTELNWSIPGAGTLNTLGTCQGGADTFETLMGGIGTYTTTASSTPTINAGGTVSGLFYFEGNGPSNEGEFNVSGINLTDDITIVAPANFEISETTGSGFTNAVLLPQTGGTVNSTTIYVRLQAGLTANSYNGDVMLTSSDADTKMVALSGLVDPADPQISMGGNISGLEYNEGSGPSPSDTFGVSGLFLSNDIVVTAPANFEISLTEMSGYSASVTLPQIGGTVDNTTIYVRLSAGLAEGTYSGDITASSSPAPSETLSISGEVFASASCAAAGDIVITEIFQNATGTDTDKEWFEVYNKSASDIDLQSWIISDNGIDSHTISSSVIVPAGGYAVLGSSTSMASNGGAPVDYQYSGITLSNSDDEIILTCNSTVIDEVAYDGGPVFPDPEGASMELSSTFPSGRNNTDNDDGANWGVAVTAFGDGDLGTPGAANDFTLSNEEFDDNGFSIYPNPTSTGFVNVKTQSSSKVSVTVYDVLGKQVISQELNDEKLDVSNLKAGVYILRITQNSNAIAKKLVIK